jgi:hypothetical protein
VREAARATAEEAVAAVIAEKSETDENTVTDSAVEVVHHHHHALPSHIPAAPAVQAVRELIKEHAEPLQVADIFCPDTEYNRAVLPSHHAIPQLDGLSAHGHVLPTPSSSSGQVFLSGLGLAMQERNISEEQSRIREREQDLNIFKNLLGKF